VDRYVIGVRQLRQQVLPPGLPQSTVWGFGSQTARGTYNAPSLVLGRRWQAESEPDHLCAR